MRWSPVLGYGLGYGLVLSVLFTAAVFAGAAMSRDFLLNDYPPAIQRRYGRPKSARGHRVAMLFGVFIWAVCGLPLMIAAMTGLDGALDDGLEFLPAAVCAALVFATLTVWDLVVLDWIILAGLRPACCFFPAPRTWRTTATCDSTSAPPSKAVHSSSSWACSPEASPRWSPEAAVAPGPPCGVVYPLWCRTPHQASGAISPLLSRRARLRSGRADRYPIGSERASSAWASRRRDGGRA